MIRISISPTAFEAISATLPLGSVGYENKTEEEGNRLIWLDRSVVDRLAVGPSACSMARRMNSLAVTPAVRARGATQSSI